MTSVELVFEAEEPLPVAAAPLPPSESDSWVLNERDPRPVVRAARNWPRNVGGFFVASLLLHVAVLAAVVHDRRTSRPWQLRLPQGHNSVALAASVSSPRSEAETTVRLKLPTEESIDEPLSRREAELPAKAAAQFASAQVDAKVPPPADVVRRDAEERPDRPDRPISTPPKRTTEARLPPRETVVRIESAASASSTASSGVKESLTPTVVVSVAPVYPSVALSAGMQGVVKLRVRVNAKGEVVSASIYQSSGHPLLDRAALDVIHRWRYSPPDGELGVAAEFIDKIEFAIHRQPRR